MLSHVPRLLLICLCACQLQDVFTQRASIFDESLNVGGGNVILPKPNIRFPRGVVDHSWPDNQELWHDILFPDNETLPFVDLVNFQDDADPWNSVCIYVPDDNTTTNDTASINYHCARGHKWCERPGGICNCNNTDGFEGVNCGIETALIDGAGCPVGCAHGVCVSDGQAGHCVCEPGFAGPLCDKKAYYHECTPHGFSVCITPFSVDTFWGDIYIKDHKFVPGCSLKKAPNPAHYGDGIVDWCQGYAIAIGFDSACGELGPTSDDGMTSFSLELMVQYAQGIVTCTDEKVTLICQYDPRSLLLYKSVVLDTRGQNNVQKEIVKFIPVYITLTTMDGGPLIPPLIVGFKVDVCVYSIRASGFGGIIVNSIVMNNTRTGVNYSKIVVYDNGCVPSSLNSVVSKAPHWTTPEDKSRICFQFKIFYFDRDFDIEYPALGLVVDVSSFTDPAEAVMPTCGGRRRRQAAGNETETVVGSVFNITIPHPNTDPDLSISTMSAREDRQWMMPVVIAAGVAALLIFVALLVIIVAYCRRGQAKDVA